MIKKFLKKIFKTISYGIFIKIYGKIEKSIDSNSDNRIKVEPINIDEDLKYNVYNISNGRIYTDRIHDVAVLIDKKVIEGPSFQLRRIHGSKIYNSNISENIVFTKGTPRKLKTLKGSMLSLLTGGGGNNNYWHWLFDVLPRLGLCSKIIDLNQIDYFLLPSCAKKFQSESLNFLNIDKSKWLPSEKFRHVKVDKLLVTDHPVVTSNDATKDIMNIPGWISQWLKDNFLKKKEKSSKEKVKKIYIDRSSQTSQQKPQRLISNEEDVRECLLKRNFTPIRLHETQFADQIELFNNAECITGLHGGGFANITFCKPGTKVIELRSSEAGDPIKNLAKKNNLNYYSINAEAKQTEKFNFPNQQGSIHISINSLNKILEN